MSLSVGRLCAAVWSEMGVGWQGWVFCLHVQVVSLSHVRSAHLLTDILHILRKFIPTNHIYLYSTCYISVCAYTCLLDSTCEAHVSCQDFFLEHFYFNSYNSPPFINSYSSINTLNSYYSAIIYHVDVLFNVAKARVMTSQSTCYDVTKHVL